jgi:cytoskeleton protein RodZ
MNESDAMMADAPRSGGSGGQLLRQLREAQGVELEVLASMMKVAPAKLEALEAGRYHELHDAAFTRALAMTVCRTLKADPAPVLATLPQAQPISLSANEPNEVPFKAKRARLNLDVPAALPWREFLTARWLAPAGVLLAAAGLYFMPQSLLSWRSEPAAVIKDTAAAASVADAASSAEPPLPVPSVAPGGEPVSADQAAAASGPTASAASASLVSPNASALAVPGAASASAPTAVAAGSAMVFTVTDSSWIQVKDADGARVLWRRVTPGETIGVDGIAPLSVKIGNASGVSVNYKGENVDLTPFTRNNVARLELK